MLIKKSQKKDSLSSLHTLLLTTLTIVVYLTIQSFVAQAPLFPADDIEEYGFIHAQSSFVNLLGKDVFGLFRPVKNILFYLFFDVFGGVRAARLVSMFIGIISYFCVRKFFERVFESKFWATYAASVWLLAPTLVSSVAWLSCVNIQFMCALVSFSLMLYDCDCFVSRLLSGIVLFFAMLSYELAVMVGPLIFVFDFYLRPARLRYRSSWFWYSGYAVVTIVYLALRFFVGAASEVAGWFDGVTRVGLVMASPYFTLWHFITWFWPFGRFTAFGSYSLGDVSMWGLVARWLIVVGCGIFALLGRRRYPVVAWAIATAFVGFLPVSNLVGLGNGPYGDYFLGLSSLGFAAGLIFIIKELLSIKGAFRKAALLVAVLLICIRLAAAIESARWATYWADGLKAFTVSTENFPELFSNYLKLVELQVETHDYEGALKTCRWLDKHLSPQAEKRELVYIARAVIAMNYQVDARMALENLEAAKGLMREGDLPNYYYLKGCVYEDLLKDDVQAESAYQTALSHSCNIQLTDAANRLVRIWSEKGCWQEAFDLLEKFLQINPTDKNARHNFQIIKEHLGKVD